MTTSGFLKIIWVIACVSVLIQYFDQVTPESFARTFWYPAALVLSLLLMIPNFASSLVRAIGTAFGGLFRFLAAVVTTFGRVLAALIGFGPVVGKGLDFNLDRPKGAKMMPWSEKLFLLNRWHGGFLLNGSKARLSQKDSFKSCVTVAGQGAGKSSTCVIPNLMTLDDCSVVVTDTKGSIYQQCSGDLAQRGFEIKVLNLMDPAHSHAYNPVMRAKTPLDVMRVVELMYRARGGHSSDPFWDDGAIRVLRIMTQVLINKGDPRYANLANVKYLLDNFDGHLKDGTQITRFVVENTLEDSGTYTDYKGLIGATAEKTLLSFVSQAATSLRLLANPDIARLLAADDFDFAAMKEKKTALFVMVRQQDMELYGFILNMFFRDLFDELLGDLRGTHPVYMLLDEFGHMKIPNFEVYATTAREYRVGYWLFLQSLGQLEHQYGRAGAQTILDGLGTRTFFGGMNLATAEQLSREMGSVLTPQRQNGSPTYYRDAPLMRAEELRALEDGRMLMMHGNAAPAVLKMTPFFKHFSFRRRTKTAPHPLPDLNAAVDLVDLEPQAPGFTFEDDLPTEEDLPTEDGEADEPDHKPEELPPVIQLPGPDGYDDREPDPR